MKRDHSEWAIQILKKADPLFRHPWVTYNQKVRSLLAPQSVWIEGGCGDNGLIRAHGHLAKTAVGVDLIAPPESPGNFVMADLNNLPFLSRCADLITLCFVAEHLQDLKRPMLEIRRVLNKKGKVVILTTNSLSPQIFLPRLLLPYRLRQKILTRYWRTSREKVFPTSRRYRGPRRLAAAGKDLHLERLDFFSDINYQRRWIFIVQLLWHLLTRPKPLEKFRTTVLISLEKHPSDED